MDNIPPSSTLHITLTLSTPTPTTTTMPNSTTPPPTLYFAYGSNLSLHQMRTRCPTSTHHGLARLPGYRWIINSRGYANIVQLATGASDGCPSTTPATSQEPPPQDPTHEVWGLVYTLQPSDERRLDGYEGVPHAYGKEWIACEVWGREGGHRGPSRKLDLLVYINRELVREAAPREEYVRRMNRGIRDALREGVPEGYVQGVLRRFIPEGEDGGEEEEEGGRA